MKVRARFRFQLIQTIFLKYFIYVISTFISLFLDKCCPMETENRDHCFSIDLAEDDKIYIDNEGCQVVQRQVSECKVKNGTEKVKFKFYFPKNNYLVSRLA